jgi:transcription-repair coupling factor (superfamily II helicase)
MKELLEALAKDHRFADIGRQLDAGGNCFVEGLWGSAAAALTAALASRIPRTTICILPQIETAEEFEEDLEFFSPGLALPFPAWERMSEEEAPDAEIRSQRLSVLKYLADLRQGAAAGHIIVAPVQALLQSVPSPAVLSENSLLLRKEMEIAPDRIAEWLAGRDFQPVRQAEVPGEFSRRGGILDIFPLTAEEPVRIEFFGDQIESIRAYDPATQTSKQEIAEISLAALPMRDGAVEMDPCSFFDHLPETAALVLREPAEIMEHANEALTRGLPGVSESAAESLKGAPKRFATLHLASLPGVFSGMPITFHVHSIERFIQPLDLAVKELELVASERERTVVLCNAQGERDRLMEILAQSPVLANKRFQVRLGRVHQGFDWTDLSFALLTHHEIFQRYRERRTIPRYRHARPMETFYELEPGDYVVHAAHGIGLFHGMTMMGEEGERQEALKIEYAGRAFLFVPASRIELVQKYIGPSEHRPPLSKLGSRSWLARKERVEESVRDLAAELLRLHAVREASPGVPQLPDTDWQREFEAAFPYEETEDQLDVAQETKTDMERTRPMDRLICGDVGYGKTEIAMRAAFKAVMSGHQVAVLVPTTVLAAQHTQTFGERMADYPVRIAMLSRFVTPAKQKEIVADLAEGSIDIVIGTHRLVQRDVLFHDLGLAVIDEEQRFGVEHKERLKRLRATVDVLTLTATPIPRTLHMSLLGIRDISSLNTPPRDRLSIHTRLMRYDAHKVRQAVLHEMARGGQVYFLHNRVETIDGMAKELRDLVPEARFVVGHGQMPERRLAQVMKHFIAHRADVLVCTTIIESGLDIPNVNTILINNADMFGLAELHQLRGRVGRYKHRAYAYLLLPPQRPVTPVAEKRLKAIEEFCELGAGFRIAMRDLEIRGAGNILGAEQSGYIAAVGYEMYSSLLEQAVRAMKNLPTIERPDVTLQLGTEAFLSKEYVPDASQRISLYRRLHQAHTAEDLETIRADMRDRFGQLPERAEGLIAEMRLRQLAQEAGIASLATADRRVIVRPARPERVARVIEAAGEECRRVDAQTFHVPTHRSRIEGPILVSFLTRMLESGLAACGRDFVTSSEQNAAPPEEIP